MTVPRSTQPRRPRASGGVAALVSIVAAGGVAAADVAFTPHDGVGLGVLAAVPFLAAAMTRVAGTVVAGAVSAGMAVGAWRYDGLPRSTDLDFVLVSIVVATLIAAASAARRGRRLRQLSHSRHVADVVQQTLLHPVPETVGDIVLATHYSSATTGAHVGGDLYDLQRTRYGVRLIVGDVRGKGLPAVRLASVALSAFREWCYYEPTLTGVAARVDASVTRHADPEEFVTAVLVEVGPDSVTVVNCGHVPPLLLDAGTVSALEPADPSLPLGLGATPSAQQLPFGPGLRLLLYTDGVIEARRRKRTFDLAREVARAGDSDAQETVRRVYARLRKFARRRLDDDVALLLLERAPRDDPHADLLSMLTMTEDAPLSHQPTSPAPS